MNITSVQGNTKIYQEKAKDSKEKQSVGEKQQDQASSTGNQLKDTVELRGDQQEAKPVTYVKPDYVKIDVLRAESEKAHAQLRQLIERLLHDQGYTYDQLLAGEFAGEMIPIDEAAQVEASQLIADDGPLGAEAVSNRIVDFAIAISGGDREQYEKLKGAIEEGFAEAQRMLGGELPEVSRKTYDLVMEKLDKWAQKNDGQGE